MVFLISFSLGFMGVCPGTESKDLNSAFQNPQLISCKIEKEILAEINPIPDLQCSSLGLVEIKNLGNTE